MPNIAEFIVNHWLLCLSLIILVGIFLSMELMDKVMGLTPLSPMEVVDWLNHKEAVAIDIRPEAEFHQGHIANAIHVARTDLPERMDQLEPYRDRPIILVCHMGRSVLPLGKQLHKQGFKQVMYLTGGMHRWQTDNLPVVKR